MLDDISAALSNAPIREGSCPDSIAMRDGAQNGKLQYAFSNSTPSRASASMCGALTSGCP
jgi:hypothetical protein